MGKYVYPAVFTPEEAGKYSVVEMILQMEWRWQRMRLLLCSHI